MQDILGFIFIGALIWGVFYVAREIVGATLELLKSLWGLRAVIGGILIWGGLAGVASATVLGQGELAAAGHAVGTSLLIAGVKSSMFA
jgi:hypothetical protein